MTRALARNEETTGLPKQYWVPGGPGDGDLSGDLDGEWEGTLPDAPISTEPSQPLGDMVVWPSIQR